MTRPTDHPAGHQETHQPKIAAILDIEQLDRYIFRGPVIPTTFTRTFGGQVAAQALAAAIRTTTADRSVHSLHAYFVRPGDATTPVIFQIDPIKEGGSFTSRHVTAIQDGIPIFSMQCSFHRRVDTGIEHSDDMRAVPNPDDIPPTDTAALPPSSRALLVLNGPTGRSVGFPPTATTTTLIPTANSSCGSKRKTGFPTMKPPTCAP